MKKLVEQLKEEAIDILKEWCPPEGYFLAFSGGKDSIVIYDLMIKSGCKFDVHFHKTSIDPPELLQFIKEYYPHVEVDRPPETMFQLILKNHMLPTRKARWCCRVLKERYGTNRIVVTGLRKAESLRRSKRQMFETGIYDKSKRLLNIIIDWTNTDVWEYIDYHKIPYCKLYREGFKRVGCLGCPMANRKQQFKRYPNVKKAYWDTMQKSLYAFPDKYFGTDMELFWGWWMSNLSPEAYLKKIESSKNQIEIDI
jgi:phosphoadenosine phosphosulfate reductase